VSRWARIVSGDLSNINENKMKEKSGVAIGLSTERRTIERHQRSSNLSNIIL